MATLFRKRNVWYLNYTVNGRRFKVSTGTANKKLAQVKLDDLKVRLFKEEVGARTSAINRTSIPEFFRRYIEYMKSNSQVDKHPDLARLGVLQEFFARKGIRHLANITPGSIDEFRVTVLKGRKPKTVKNYITLLKTALNKAVEWDIIEHNPIAKVRSPKIVKTFHFFDRDEIRKLIAEADEPLRTGIILLAHTGMRRAELFNVRWRDVDLSSKILRVWPYDGFSPKGKRPRAVPLSDEALKVLRALNRGRGESKYVFRPFEGINTLYRHFAALTKKLGIKGTLHDLRHTSAGNLATEGVPVPVIKELLGHSDIATTMIYAHLSPDTHKAAIRKLKY